MSGTPTGTVRRRAHTPPAVRGWIFGGLALAWYAVSTFGPLELPAFAVVCVLGVLVLLSVEPDVGSPTRGVTRPGGTSSWRSPAVVAFVPVAGGMNLLLGGVPIEAGHAVLATLAAACVALPRLAETRGASPPGGAQSVTPGSRSSRGLGHAALSANRHAPCSGLVASHTSAMCG